MPLVFQSLSFIVQEVGNPPPSGPCPQRCQCHVRQLRRSPQPFTNTLSPTQYGEMKPLESIDIHWLIDWPIGCHSLLGIPPACDLQHFNCRMAVGARTLPQAQWILRFPPISQNLKHRPGKSAASSAANSSGFTRRYIKQPSAR